MSQGKFSSFRDFYPYYLNEHQNINCRRLHFIGACLAIFCLLMAVTKLELGWLPVAFVLGYLFAWIGHFFFEKNRPATFKYPLFSFMGDWAMFRDILTGRVKV